MEFKELANKVCGELPDGWNIRIDLELDSGSVTLEDDSSEEQDYPTNFECIEEQVLDALEFAKEEDAKQKAKAGTGIGDLLQPFGEFEPPIDLNPSLPVPRLEMIFVKLERPLPRGYTALWFQRLIVQHLEGHLESIVFGVTQTDAKGDFAEASNPFRAHPQTLWLADHMRTPAFRVFKGEWTPLLPDSKPEWLANVRTMNQKARSR
jgi:hypothetical protein